MSDKVMVTDFSRCSVLVPADKVSNTVLIWLTIRLVLDAVSWFPAILSFLQYHSFLQTQIKYRTKSYNRLFQMQCLGSCKLHLPQCLSWPIASQISRVPYLTYIRATPYCYQCRLQKQLRCMGLYVNSKVPSQSLRWLLIHMINYRRNISAYALDLNLTRPPEAYTCRGPNPRITHAFFL